MPEETQEIHRATADNIGCWLDEANHGHYGQLHMADIARAYGWQPDELDAALCEWYRHPEREDLPEVLAAHDPESLGQMFADMADDVEKWMNDFIVPLDADGEPLASFGWYDGSFYLQTSQWWEQDG